MTELRSFFNYLSLHSSVLFLHLFQHIYISFSAIILAIIIGIPLGIWAHQRIVLRHIIMPTNNIFQTIPSLALLAFLIPFVGIGFKPTIITLTIYALLPITRNTYIGLSQIPPETIEAANCLGFTRWQKLKLVELPLAMPVIFSGIRVATAMAIGITTIAAFIGAGGLGVFITQGLSLDDSNLILLGAIPTALLALVVDGVLAQIEQLFIRPRKKRRFEKTRWFFVFLVIALFAWLCTNQLIKTESVKKNHIVIATKNFTESYILGYLMSDIIKSKTDVNVVLKLNLGSTAVLQNAMLRGDIDLYPEYTGTAYFAVLHQMKILSPNQTFKFVRNAYKKRFHLIWLAPFGFNNSQTLAVRANFAKRYHLKTLSDLGRIAPTLTIAAPAAFIKRPDALPALQKGYDLHFKKIIAMQPDLVFKAINNKRVDVIELFTTDPRIQANNLVTLEDNKHVFPPYDAAPIIREETLQQYPAIKAALNLLANRIDEKTMRRLNAEVIIQKKSPQQVAHDFLTSLKQR